MILVMASLVVVLAGIKAASIVIVPFLLSMFIAIMLMPLLETLVHRRVPNVLALVMVFTLMIIVFSLIGLLVGHALNDFSMHYQEYEKMLETRIDNAFDWLHQIGFTVPRPEAEQAIDPGRIFTFLTNALKGFGELLADGIVIMFTTIFMLLEGVQFREKMLMIFRDSDDSIERFNQIIDKIKHYMALKALISVATGLLVYILLRFFGLDYPVLWAVMAFLFNFIPNIGSIIAAIPAVLLALIQLDLFAATWIAVGYVAINTIVGSIIEPKVMGKGLDLSTLVVFLSLIFWGWLLGPVGMLLSIPLTIVVKIILASDPQTHWVAVMLGAQRSETR